MEEQGLLDGQLHTAVIPAGLTCRSARGGWRTWDPPQTRLSPQRPRGRCHSWASVYPFYR